MLGALKSALPTKARGMNQQLMSTKERMTVSKLCVGLTSGPKMDVQENKKVMISTADGRGYQMLSNHKLVSRIRSGKSKWDNRF